MKINSVGRTNFGLTIHPSMKAILDKSKAEVAKQGRKEAELWRRNVKVLDKTAPDNYTLYIDQSNTRLSKPYSVCLKMPNGSIFALKELRPDEILGRNAIKDINEQIRDRRKDYDDPCCLF